MTKTKTLQVRLDPLNMDKLDELAKERGVNRSEMLRIILEDTVRGRVNSETGAINLVEADGTVIHVEQTAEELAVRE